jgi:hypothetical protein
MGRMRGNGETFGVRRREQANLLRLEPGQLDHCSLPESVQLCLLNPGRKTGRLLSEAFWLKSSKQGTRDCWHITHCAAERPKASSHDCNN